MNRKTILGTVLLLTVLLSVGAAWGAVGDYILKGNQVYRVDGGKETLLEDEEPVWKGTDAGLLAWVLVDPEQTEEMKGSEGGIYFFQGEERKPAGFLPLKNAGTCALEPSPTGEKMLISRGSESKRQLELYDADMKNNRFVRKAEFVSAGRFFWVDPLRFVFNSVDERKGPRVKNWQYRGNEGWRCSVVLYDTVEKSLTVLKQATDTTNYTVTGCDGESGELEIWEHFVKKVKDWNDDTKVQSRDFRIPVPAAG